MSIQINKPALGIMLGAIGGLAISFDVPMIRLAGSDPWLIMFFRGAVLAIIFLLVWLFFRPKDTPANPLSDKYWMSVGILYGTANICFALGVFYTSTANLVFILAFNPMAAALFSWWLIGERPKPITWLALFMTIIGVGIIVRGGLTGGTYLGDMFALLLALQLALLITLTRKSGKNLALAPGFGGCITAAFSLPLVIAYSSTPESWGWVISNAAILVPIAAFCLALAPRFIPAPQAAMFYLLETVLAPIWVWMVFGEVITNETLIGGTIVLVAILGHSYLQLKNHQRAKASQNAEVA